MRISTAVCAALLTIGPATALAESEPETEPAPESESESVPASETAVDTAGSPSADSEPQISSEPPASTPRGPESESVPESTGPQIVVPPEIDPLRGMQQARMNRPSKTTIGGYGELHFNMSMPEGGGDRDTEIDLHRLVLFFAHRFDERFRLYIELEVEHALVGDGAPGEVGLEQAFIDWQILDNNALTLRTGIVLVPMGIINQWHEPPIFHGVERPRVDASVIPTTWREAAIGVTGEPIEGLRYEAYLMSGLDASGFSGSNGLRGGRQKVAEAITNGPAFSGRLEIEPTLGMVAGASLYVGFAGANTDAVDKMVNVTGASADWRMHKRGFETKALVAYFHVTDTDALRVVPTGETDPVSDVGSNIFGAYGEVAYDVLFCHASTHALLPFVRLEYYDTTLGESATFNRPSVIDFTAGLTYRPIAQVAFKADFLLRRPSSGTGSNVFNLGIGWMF